VCKKEAGGKGGESLCFPLQGVGSVNEIKNMGKGNRGTVIERTGEVEGGKSGRGRKEGGNKKKSAKTRGPFYRRGTQLDGGKTKGWERQRRCEKRKEKEKWFLWLGTKSTKKGLKKVSLGQGDQGGPGGLDKNGQSKQGEIS